MSTSLSGLPCAPEDNMDIIEAIDSVDLKLGLGVVPMLEVLRACVAHTADSEHQRHGSIFADKL
eukprot:1295103-Amphidinium_carterae.1